MRRRLQKNQTNLSSLSLLVEVSDGHPWAEAEMFPGDHAVGVFLQILSKVVWTQQKTRQRQKQTSVVGDRTHVNIGFLSVVKKTKVPSGFQGTASSFCHTGCSTRSHLSCGFLFSLLESLVSTCGSRSLSSH